MFKRDEPTPNKEKLLKARLIECVDRMKKLLELNAPGTIVGLEAFSIYATCLSVYGLNASWAMADHIRDQNLLARGVCRYGDCTNPVSREGIGICMACQKEIGVDPESMKKLHEEIDQMEREGKFDE